MIEVSPQRFEEMVERALDKVPERFVAHMRNLVIQVADFNEESPHILGLYTGVALPERTYHHSGFLPDSIYIYQGALQRVCNTEAELEREVEVTVFHELGHYFGFDDEQLHQLGWG